MHQDMQLAADLHRAGRLFEADAVLRRILVADPHNATAHYRLGAIAHQRGRLPEALEHLASAEQLAPGQPATPYLHGIVLHDAGLLEEAAAKFREAIALKPDFVQAQNNLALVLKDLGQLGEALRAIESALRTKPDYAVASNNHGILLLEAERQGEAAEAFRRAVRLQPTYAEAWYNLARLHMRSGNLPEALEAFQRVIRLDPDRARLDHARCLEHSGRVGEAIAALKEALVAKPDHVEHRLALARLLAMTNQTAEAREHYEFTWQLHPENPRAALGATLTLPVIHESLAELVAAREGYIRGLARLHANVEKFLDAPRASALASLQWRNFYLAYQGKADKEPQGSYGDFVARLARHFRPDLMRPIAPRSTPLPRARVGFASSFFTRCTVGMHFKSWITRLDRSRFEIHVYHLTDHHDSVSREIEAASDSFLRLNTNPDHVAERIKGDALDILVYPELGMNPQTFLLAALRLAPVQCCGWGHPVTTGHANVDFFLTSDKMEPADAASDYTERLVRLDGIGTCYPRPTLPTPKHRADFGLPEHKHLYLFPQSPFKIHPDNDTLLARILAADPLAALVFFEGRHHEITQAFLRRFNLALSGNGISADGRVITLPYMSHEDYLRVNMLCDVMLDSLLWSGGNTSLDALACGLPIVTLPGEFMRGRQSAGMLALAGTEELIARDEEDYVRIAVRIANDPAWRGQIQAKLLSGADALFERMEPIRALERFFLSSCPSG